MAFQRPSRVRLIWWLELGLGLELYACAVLALHARGLRVTPLLVAPALIIPALVIPPVFYLLVGLVIVRPLTRSRLLTAAAAMCGIHAFLVVVTGVLYTIPDLVEFAAAVAFALWGSPVVTLLQLTAAPLVFARLRPLILAPRSVSHATGRVAQTPRSVEAPSGVTPRTLGAPRVETPSFPDPRGLLAPSTAPRALATPVSTPSAVVQPVATTSVTPPPLAAPPPVAPSPLPSLIKPSPPIGGPAASNPSRSISDDGEAMVRVPFSRIADQLPVEMFARGREGLNATLRPGVSLLVPRRLILPHLGEGLAPVEWKAIADQFPWDELALSHDEIARRLPRGSLLLPLDEVVPQIPPQLLTLSTPPIDVYGIEEFPPPFQPHVPPPSEPAADEPEARSAPPASESTASVSRPREEPAPREEPETPPEPELELVAEAEALLAEPDPVDEAEPIVDLEPVDEAADVTEPEPEVLVEPMALEESEPGASDGEPPVTVERVRTAEAGRIAALLAPMMNGLEIAERVESGTPLVTVVAPPVSEDAVVRTTARLVPYLTDTRLSEPATQATLTTADAAVVVTPIGSNGDGAILVAALASRASLAWLERLSRSAAGDGRGGGSHGKAAGRGGESGSATGLRATSVPSSVSELADAMTAFGPVSPTVLRDPGGSLRACLFLPRSLEALPLAEYAHDLYGALDGTELGEVFSVVLRVGAYCLLLRAMDGASSGGTVLVGGGPTDRLGLARIELDRAATRLGALVRG
jgi:hypothetical protein